MFQIVTSGLQRQRAVSSAFTNQAVGNMSSPGAAIENNFSNTQFARLFRLDQNYIAITDKGSHAIAVSAEPQVTSSAQYVRSQAIEERAALYRCNATRSKSQHTFKYLTGSIWFRNRPRPKKRYRFDKF
jgi:hypothetical protein